MTVSTLAMLGAAAVGFAISMGSGAALAQGADTLANVTGMGDLE